MFVNVNADNRWVTNVIIINVRTKVKMWVDYEVVVYVVEFCFCEAVYVNVKFGMLLCPNLGL